MSIDPTGPGTPMGGGGTAATQPLGDGQQHTTQGQHGGGPSAGVMTPYGRPGVYIYPFWQRSEFWIFLLTSIAIAIAGSVQNEFGADRVWTLITVLGAAYILSRGFAKREPRDDDGDQPWTPGGGAGGEGSGRFTRGGMR